MTSTNRPRATRATPVGTHFFLKYRTTHICSSVNIRPDELSWSGRTVVTDTHLSAHATVATNEKLSGEGAEGTPAGCGLNEADRMTDHAPGAQSPNERARTKRAVNQRNAADTPRPQTRPVPNAPLPIPGPSVATAREVGAGRIGLARAHLKDAREIASERGARQLSVALAALDATPNRPICDDVPLLDLLDDPDARYDVREAEQFRIAAVDGGEPLWTA